MKTYLSRALSVALIFALLAGPQATVVYATDARCADQKMGGQRETYCEAAKDSEKSANTAMAGMAIWGIVTGVCTAACVSSAATFATMESVCMWSSLGGAVADIGLTIALSKDMSQSMGAMTGLLGAGMTGYMMYSGHAANVAASNVAKGLTKPTSYDQAVKSNNAVAANKDAAKPKRGAACMSAAMAALQTVMKGVTMSQANSQKEQALKSAGSIKDERPASASLEPAPGNAGTIANTGRAGGLSASGTANSGGGDSGGSTACEAHRQSGNTQAFLSCATAGNSELQKFMNTPGLNDAFKAASGKDIGDYIKGLDGATGAAQAAGGALAGMSNASALQGELNSMEKQVAGYTDLSGAGRYAASGSGGGGAASGGGENDEFSKAMQAMMGQMMGEGSGAKLSDPEMQKIRFAMEGKDPSVVAENRGLSIFARVAYRYRQSQDKIEQGVWTATHNRALYAAPPQRGIASDPNRRTN